MHTRNATHVGVVCARAGVVHVHVGLHPRARVRACVWVEPAHVEPVPKAARSRPMGFETLLC